MRTLLCRRWGYMTGTGSYGISNSIWAGQKDNWIDLNRSMWRCPRGLCWLFGRFKCFDFSERDERMKTERKAYFHDDGVTVNSEAASLFFYSWWLLLPVRPSWKRKKKRHTYTQPKRLRSGRPLQREAEGEIPVEKRPRRWSRRGGALVH